MTKSGDLRLTPELLLRAYTAGIFPMSDGRHDPDIFWVEPKSRGILPLDGIHISGSLKKTLRRKIFEVRCDTAFEDVIVSCAEACERRHDTWINDEIIRAYCELHKMGFAHSVECLDDGKLVGGLYGVSIGGAFCGESMFSRTTDASKVALVHLVARLRLGGYQLLDVQFLTDHLKRFGAIEIPADDYLERLNLALERKTVFNCRISPSKETEIIESLLSSIS